MLLSSWAFYSPGDLYVVYDMTGNSRHEMNLMCHHMSHHNSTAHLCQYLAFAKLMSPPEFHLLSQKPREVGRIYIVILRRSSSSLGMIPLSGRWETRTQVSCVMFFLHLVPLLDALFLDPVITVCSVTGAQHELEEVYSGHWRCSDN